VETDRVPPGIEQPVIETSRLRLRPFVLGDAEVVRCLVNNYNVSKTTLNIPYPYEAGVAEKWIGGHARLWELRAQGSWAITRVASDTLLGAITLTWINRTSGELGYWIGESYWGNGYCSEAARALIAFGFERLEMMRIVAEHLRSNPASGRVMVKAGMRHAGSRRKRDRHRQMTDLDIYEIRSN
jgi:RimJ/RimL family protein N-acetyltransferase